MIPRVHDKLFRHTFFRPWRANDKPEGQTAMDVYLQELLYNRRQLMKEDLGTMMSDNVLGYFALLRSGVSDRKRVHVSGLSFNSVNYQKVSEQLRDPYPGGSMERRKAHPPRREGCAVELMKEDYSYSQADDDPEPYYPGEDGIDREGLIDAEDQATANGLQAFLSPDPLELGDEHMSYAAHLDPELADAWVSMKEDHAKMHELKKQRGFFKGSIDGMRTSYGEV